MIKASGKTCVTLDVMSAAMVKNSDSEYVINTINPKTRKTERLVFTKDEIKKIVKAFIADSKPITVG